MRNLKRALSLALASVMLLGMMVVGTSAASYPDVDENDNVEAIEVLNAVNVMIGRQGNFEPDEAVNRHEMAVIMAKLVLGVEIADNYVGTHPFTDVVPWADKYVAACYENGLIYGTSATTYGGGQPLTAVQAAAMMLRALGYKDLNKGYQGDWRAPITAMANQIRLFSGVASNPNEKLDRNQVAQLALNTLKSPMVNLKDNTISWSNDEGQIIMTGGSREYIVLSSKEAYAQAINNVESSGTSASMIGGYTVELGEHLYNGKLKLNDVTDVFGRPAREWEYDGKVIGDYIKEELMVMDKVGKVTGLDLYNLIGKATLDKYDLTVSVDGISDYEVYDRIPNAVEDHKSNSCVIFNKTDLNRNNKATIGATGTGVLTQVFVDHQTNDIYVAIINTYLARATKAYDTKKEEATVEVYALDKETKTGMYGKTGSAYDKKSTYSESFALGNEDFALVKDIAKDDPFLVTVADGAIQTIKPAEVLSDTTISAFKKGDYVVSGGTQYDYTTTADYNYEDLYFYTSEDNVAVNLKDITYNIFLDQYGNLIGLEANEKPNNYVFLTSIDLNGSNISNRTATANAIFLDGTVETISINMNKSTWRDNREWNNTTAFTEPDGDPLLNTWATYTKSGDVYTIKEVWNVDEPDGDKNPMNDFGEAYRAPKATEKDVHGNYNDTKLAQFRDVIGKFSDRTEITLKNGLRMYGGYSTSDKTSYSNVYGDSSSVYLTAEMSQVRNSTGTVYGVIKGVETVHNGIDGTSITIWDQDNAYDEAYKDLKIAGMEEEDVAYGVYTLYNDKGIVIAAMIVGEGSSSSELVYVTSSDAKLESDNGSSAKAAGDGLYTWTREVVRNGEKIDLTEVGDVIDEISAANMKQNEWYQVKTDGNGNVVKAEPAFYALDYYEFGEKLGRSAFTSEYEHINDVVEVTGVTTVVYHEDNGPASNMKEDNHNKNHINTNYECSHTGFYADDKLEVKGNNVLAVNTRTGSGIYFRNDVNVVLVYWNRNTNNTDVMLGEGVEDLKDMVDYVNENSAAAKLRNDSKDRLASETYFLSALIENGAATTIVIQDRFNPYASGDHVDKPAGDQILTLGGIFNNTYETKNNSDVYLVSGRETTRLESIDDLGTATVNGFKRYEVRGGDRIRVLDKDLDKDFIPYFSPVNTNNAYNFKLYADGVYATNPYIEFTMPKNSDLIVRQWQVGDEFPISIKGDVTVKRGTTVLKDGDAVKMGQELTITFDATKVDVTVNGDAIATGDTYIVKATDYALSIVATDKGTTEPDPEGKPATVTVTNGLVNIRKDGAVISKITADFKMDTAGMGLETGDTIAIEPASALNIVGAKDNSDGTFTIEKTAVTISPKAEYTWHPLFRQYIDKDGNPTLVEWKSAAAVAAMNFSAKRFSLARAAADDLVDEDKGESKIDTSKLNWFYEAYTAGVRNFEFRTRLADGTTVFVENVTIDGTKITVTYDKTKFTPAQYEEYLGVLDANVNDVVTVNPGTDTPTPADRVIVEPANATKTAFNVYRYKAEPKNADIPALVLAEIQKTDKTATKAEWKANNPVGNAGQITVTYTQADETEKKADRAVTIVDVAKVIYGTKELGYVAKTGNTKSLGSFGEKAILLGGAKDIKTGAQLTVTKVGETYQVVPNPGTAVDDYYIYDAVKVSAANASVVIDAWADGNPEGGVLGAVVVPGIDLYLTLDVATSDKGKDLELRSGDKVIKTVKFNNDGPIKYALENVSKDWADKNGEIKLSLSSQKYTVKLGSETVTGANGDKVTLKTAQAGEKYIVKNLTTAAANAKTTGYTSGLEYTINSADAVNGVINIYPAYVFDWGTGSDPVSAAKVTVGSAKADTDASVESGADDQLVAVGAKVWITGKASSNQEVNIGDTALKVEHPSANTTDPWKYSFIMPSENVTAKAFVPTSFGTPTLANGTTLNTAGTTVTYGVTAATVGGLDVTGDVTVKWYSDADKTSTDSAPTNLVVKTATTTSLVFTTAEKAKVAVGDYYFTLSIGSVESAVQTLSVTAPVAANGTDLENLLKEEDDVILDNGASAAVISNVTIENGKTVTASKGSADLTLTDVTVAKGGKLEITNAVKLGGHLTVNGTLELTGAIAGDKLNVNGKNIILNEGATLILSEIYDDLSDLGIKNGSKGTVVINKTTTDAATTTLANLCATVNTTPNEAGGYTVTKSDALKIQTETPNVYLKDFSALKMQVGKTYSMYNLSGVVAAVDNDKVKAVATYADGSTKVIIAGPNKLDEYTVNATNDCTGGKLDIQGLFETTIEKIVVTLTANADGSVTTYTFNFK